MGLILIGAFPEEAVHRVGVTQVSMGLLHCSKINVKLEKLGTLKLVLPTIIFKNAPYKHIPALVSKCDLWLVFYGIGCMVAYVGD